MPTAIAGLNAGLEPGGAPAAATPAPVVSALVEFGAALHVLRDLPARRLAGQLP
jgi:hypothetical protein